MTEAVQPNVLASLGLNGKLFLSQLLNVAIVLLVVWRWVYKPLLKVMDAREQKIKEGLENATNAKQWIAEAAEQKDQMVREAMGESQRLIKEAQATAEARRQDILRETQADLDRQLQEARARLKEEKEAMVQVAKNELVDLIAAATEKVTQMNVDDKAQSVLIEKTLKSLERSSSV